MFTSVSSFGVFSEANRLQGVDRQPRANEASQQGSNVVRVDLAASIEFTQTRAAGLTETRIRAWVEASVESVDANPDASATNPSRNLPDFSPEAVAARILNFAKGFLDQAESQEQYDYLVSEIDRGIQAGLAEARQVLDSLGALNGQIADDVDQTEGLLLSGVERLLTANPFDLADKITDLVEVIGQPETVSTLV